MKGPKLSCCCNQLFRFSKIVHIVHDPWNICNVSISHERCGVWPQLPTKRAPLAIDEVLSMIKLCANFWHHCCTKTEIAVNKSLNENLIILSQTISKSRLSYLIEPLEGINHCGSLEARPVFCLYEKSLR